MSDFLDKAAQAQKAAAQNPDAEAERPDIWKPTEVGEQLLGVVVDVAWPFIQKANENRWVIEITDRDDKTWTVWCGAVLKRLLIEKMPAIGAEIAITYDGNERKTSQGFNYRAFQMAVSQFDAELYQNIQRQTMVKQEMQAIQYAVPEAPSRNAENVDPF